MHLIYRKVLKYRVYTNLTNSCWEKGQCWLRRFWQVRCIPDVPVSASKHREPHIVSGTKSNWEAQGSDRCIGERGWVNERSKYGVCAMRRPSWTGWPVILLRRCADGKGFTMIKTSRGEVSVNILSHKKRTWLYTERAGYLPHLANLYVIHSDGLSQYGLWGLNENWHELFLLSHML